MAREMKDSGIEWIGEIPREWDIVSIGRLFCVLAGGDAKPEYYSPVKNEAHPFPVYTNTMKKDQVYSYTSKPFFRENTITVTGRGAIGIAFFRETPYDAIIRLLSLSPKFNIDGRFYAYWINSVIHFFSDSAAVGQLSAIQMAAYKTVYCSKDEQILISNFLDTQCAHIDSVIEKTRAAIEEYKKLKQSVITQAVTKGIRPNREMKDSGIEWIGEIPKEWDTLFAFQVFEQVKNKNTGLIESNLLSLSYGKIIRKSIDTTFGLLPESFEGYNIINEDDIVLRLTDLQNDHKSLRVGITKQKGIITSAYLTLRNNSKSCPDYLYYYLHSFDVAKGFYGMGAGVRQGLNWNELKHLIILCPPENEQTEIVSFLNCKIPEIDSLISKKEQLITELEAYKKSLIYEYVTGKKEVLV